MGVDLLEQHVLVLPVRRQQADVEVVDGVRRAAGTAVVYDKIDEPTRLCAISPRAERPELEVVSMRVKSVLQDQVQKDARYFLFPGHSMVEIHKVYK